MIQVENLTKAFRDLRRGQVLAIEDVSFEAKGGEIFGLLGPNGAGKTTTMRVLCTVLRPTSGVARVAGYDVVTQAAQVRQHIGFLSANTAVYDRMSAWELLDFFGRLYGMDGDHLQARLEYVFAMLRMNDFREVVGAKMSTGMRQKVSIARSILHDPPVLIFDEPTLGLDVLVARSVVEAIHQLRDMGKCIIYSTHIMHEVEKLCDRVAIISQGKVCACGTLMELREQFGQEDMEELFYTLVSAPS
jgi:sodium transport system ATP-binding protein